MIVTKDSTVMAFGENNCGCLGVNLFGRSPKPIEVFELRNKKILKIDSGFSHTTDNSCFVLALVKNELLTEVYSWGNNKFGQIGHGNTVNIIRPKMIKFFSDKSICDISCGSSHALILSSNGYIYTFVKNANYQSVNQNIAVKVNGINHEKHGKAIAIACGSDISIALTNRGQVYCWGDNRCGQLGFGDSASVFYAIPTHLNMGDVWITKICCGLYHTLLLSKDLDIYEFGNRNEKSVYSASPIHSSIPIKINNENKFKDIATHKTSKISVGLAENGLCYYWGNNSKTTTKSKFNFANKLNKLKSEYSTIVETFACYSEPQVTYKMVTLLFDDIFLNGKYGRLFIEHPNSVLGSGAYSTVFEARMKNSTDVYAIKKIPLSFDEYDIGIKEIKFLLCFKENKHIVKIYDYWYEDNYYHQFCNRDSLANVSSCNSVYQTDKNIILHIQMELCPISLKKVIEILNHERENSIISVPLFYYIISQLFLEILEAVSYLHKLNPPLIHRDLKPDNILVTLSSIGRFIKIADLGLSTMHEFKDQSHSKDVGTTKYRAPEVIISKHYDVNADLYSIGVIGDDFLGKLVYDSANQILIRKHEFFVKILKLLKSKEAENRPNCDKIIKRKSDWLLDLEDIKNDDIFEILDEQQDLNDLMNDFVKFFIKIKLKQQQKVAKINNKERIDDSYNVSTNNNIPQQRTNKRFKLNGFNNEVSNLNSNICQTLVVHENEINLNNASQPSYKAVTKRQRVMESRLRIKERSKQKEIEDEKRRQEKLIENRKETEEIDNLKLRTEIIELKMKMTEMEDDMTIMKQEIKSLKQLLTNLGLNSVIV